MPDTSIPEIVIGRLPIYLRTLSRMAAAGKVYTSSHELGQHLGISSAQIRKDLSHFGEFGKQGTGYNISFLTAQLKRILKVDSVQDVALIGVGDLGRAIAHYQGFLDRGFRVTALFDNDPEKIGTKIGGLVIQDYERMETDIRQQEIRIAMLAVPFTEAQNATDILVKAGIQAILSYAPISIKVPAHVHVEYIDPVLHLQKMTFFLE
ncbi:MAG: redox-sensing transcriptional repressor Rex [Anaerolineales bacterium]|nr:redox-sensing transcriptional repressor Rex [Anaerolineales bacterium]